MINIYLGPLVQTIIKVYGNQFWVRGQVKPPNIRPAEELKGISLRLTLLNNHGMSLT